MCNFTLSFLGMAGLGCGPGKASDCSTMAFDYHPPQLILGLGGNISLVSAVQGTKMQCLDENPPALAHICRAGLAVVLSFLFTLVQQ